MALVSDQFWHGNKDAVGVVFIDYDTTQDRCQYCNGGMCQIKTPGRFLYKNQYGTWDITQSASKSICATCGAVPNQTHQIIAYPHPSLVANKVGSKLADLAGVNSVVRGTAQKAKRLCECGAWVTSLDYTPAHSTWCPAFSNTPPKRAETQEELVARVRKGKAFASVP